MSTKRLIEAEIRKGPCAVSDLVKRVGVSRVSVSRALKKMELDGKAFITGYYKPLVGACVPLWAYGGRASVPRPGKLNSETKAANDRASKQNYKLAMMMQRRERLDAELRDLDARIESVRVEHERARIRAAKELGLRVT